MLDTTKIGDSIHAHRKRAGLTQRKLGELARIGISNISSYENGKIPCLYNAIAIADALRVSLDDLIGRVVMDCPTLTPPNEPLTLEQLREMEDPVWCVCKTVEGFEGFWCLCNHGYILTPARQIFDVKEIPHWVFYRRPPEGEE